MRAAAVLVALAACGDNIAGLALDDYGEARRAAECERLTRCGLFSNQDACERFLLPSLDRDTRAAIDEKKIAYDAVAAKACLAAVTEQSCDTTSADVRTASTACTRTFRGLVPDGATCMFDLECASGSCDAPACPINECCAGSCRSTIANAAINDVCNRDNDCMNGFCSVDGRCHPHGAARDMCTRDEECDIDLACIGATDLEPGRCRDLPVIGEQCPYMRCAEIGATCVGGSCVALGIGGAACSTAAECSPYGECNSAGMCVELPTLGQTCTIACSRDAWCDGGQCAALLPDTSPCSAGNQCESLYCNEGDVFDACAEPVTCI